eukprot:scaffold1685_cov91-Cylindrotheca_fusiformis.AAC.2
MKFLSSLPTTILVSVLLLSLVHSQEVFARDFSVRNLHHHPSRHQEHVRAEHTSPKRSKRFGRYPGNTNRRHPTGRNGKRYHNHQLTQEIVQKVASNPTEQHFHYAGSSSSSSSGETSSTSSSSTSMTTPSQSFTSPSSSTSEDDSVDIPSVKPPSAVPVEDAPSTKEEVESFRVERNVRKQLRGNN